MIKLKIYQDDLGCIETEEFEDIYQCRRYIELYLKNMHPSYWHDYDFRVWHDDVEEHFDIVYTAKVEWSQ